MKHTSYLLAALLALASLTSCKESPAAARKTPPASVPTVPAAAPEATPTPAPAPSPSDAPAPASTPSAAPAAAPTPTPAPTPTAASAAAAGDLTVTVENASQGTSGESAATTLSAATKGQALVASLVLTTYCSPKPSFTATIDGDALRLQLVKPDDVARCFTVHRLDARVAGAGATAVKRVVLVSASGKEDASAPVR